MRIWLAALIVAACSSNNNSGNNSGVDGGGGGSGSGSGTGSGSGSGSGSALDQVRANCVAQTNTYRAMNGVAALVENAALETYADAGAMYDITHDPHDHFTMTEGGGIAFAENECPGQDGWMLDPGGDLNALMLQCLDAFYSEGPGSDYSTHGHYINMMGDYGTLGCGFYQMGDEVTIVQDYGM